MEFIFWIIINKIEIIIKKDNLEKMILVMGKKKDNDFELKFNKYKNDGEKYGCPICKKKTEMLWGRCRNCGSSLTEEK